MAGRVYYDGSEWLQENGRLLTVHGKVRRDVFLVSFDDSPKFTANSKAIKKGGVRDLNLPSVSSVGYYGYGEYVTKIDHIKTTEYEVWRGMIRRCYQSNFPQYERYGKKGVTVCKDWHNFQNFADWYTKQPMYGKGYHLDKDLLNSGAKEYSPDNCTFVSPAINSLFTGGFKTIVYQRRAKWVVHLQMGEKCSNGNKRQSYFGEYTDKQEALEVYFKHKIAHVIKVANQEKANLDERVYSNLTDPVWVRDYINLLASEHEDNK